MTIEEQITIFEHNAEHERKEGDLNIYLNFRQLVEWLKELQIYRRNLTNQSISDLLVQSENENERLHDRTNELEKELQAHREAWKKILDEMMDVSIPGQDAEYVYENIYDIIRKYRPKEGDKNE